MKTFITATTIVIATLDILDVSRILPVLFERFFDNVTYRQVYCSLGVFHELAVALFLVSISVAVAVQVCDSFCVVIWTAIIMLWDVGSHHSSF